MTSVIPKKELHVDFCIVGGGLSGLCAAVAAAREGTKVALIQERPVLGGNASSEIRMWVCGAKDCRETGILEELQLENLYYNPYKLYPVWDSLMLKKVQDEQNITLLLNTSCFDATMDGDTIKSVTAWQMTTQTFYTVYADRFADCSGDSVLAPLTGAAYRVGRESAEEFGEDIVETVADRMTMGMSCLLQARQVTQPVKFIAPPYARKLTKEEFDNRRPNMNSTMENFWYLELGGDRDSIHDTEAVRDELVALALGFWDYYKNSSEYPEADYWQLDFLGFLPGKRESRRMVGAYTMTQNDVLSGGKFTDTVAFGGWPLDDHDPHGFFFRGVPCVQRQDTPSPFGIPYRSLYSANVRNLFFAGRNISMTHAAMSSARVMATCAVLGQAVGEAAALATKYACLPDEIYTDHLSELQEKLQYHDCFLPYFSRKVNKLTATAALLAPEAENAENLRNGMDRTIFLYGPQDNGCTVKLGSPVTYRFAQPQYVATARLTFDSDLERQTVPGDACERRHSMRCNTPLDAPVMTMPQTLVRAYTVSVTDEMGNTSVIFSTEQNLHRTVWVPVGQKISAVTFTPLTLWGEQEQNAHVFSFDLYETV